MNHCRCCWHLYDNTEESSQFFRAYKQKKNHSPWADHLSTQFSSRLPGFKIWAPQPVTFIQLTPLPVHKDLKTHQGSSPTSCHDPLPAPGVMCWQRWSCWGPGCRHSVRSYPQGVKSLLWNPSCSATGCFASPCTHAAAAANLDALRARGTKHGELTRRSNHQTSPAQCLIPQWIKWTAPPQVKQNSNVSKVQHWC